eukprot:850998-Pyramimonas_sp.AAC.1
MQLGNLEACPGEYRSVPSHICHLDRAKLLSEGLRQDLDQQSLNVYVAEGILGDFLKDLEIALRTESSRGTLGSIKSWKER